MAREAVAHVSGVRVEAFPGLAIDAAKTAGADFIVKGLRTPADFEVEQQMALTNHSVSGVRTVYVPCRPDLSFVSSRFIREIAQYGGNVRHLVPRAVAEQLAKKFPAGGPTA
jgi:pantetheine-phosphate adenylyltransferase